MAPELLAKGFFMRGNERNSPKTFLISLLDVSISSDSDAPDTCDNDCKCLGTSAHVNMLAPAIK